MLMKPLSVLGCILLTVALAVPAFAQRPGNRGKFRARAMNANGGIDNGIAGQGAFDVAGNQGRDGGNMPGSSRIAQMLITNFDADGSGTLDVTELQSALQGLRQMQNGRNRGQGIQNQDTLNNGESFANNRQATAMQSRQNGFGGQGQLRGAPRNLQGGRLSRRNR